MLKWSVEKSQGIDRRTDQEEGLRQGGCPFSKSQKFQKKGEPRCLEKGRSRKNWNRNFPG